MQKPRGVSRRVGLLLDGLPYDHHHHYHALLKLTQPSRRSINLSGIFLLTDGMKRDFGLEGIQAFAKECHKLTSINLSSCFQVHQISMTAIARNMPNLKELNLSSCKRIDYKALRPVSQLCPLLSKINFTNCERVDDRCISVGIEGVEQGGGREREREKFQATAQNSRNSPTGHR